MSKIKVKFPNGFEALATVREKEEPELAAKLMEKLANGPLPCACYHTISTGCFFSATPRPPRHPVPSGTQVDSIGNEQPKLIMDLEAGDISFTGWAFWITYGFTSETVPIGGPVIAKVDADSMEGFLNACKDVWFHDYIYRKLAVITFEKAEG